MRATDRGQSPGILAGVDEIIDRHLGLAAVGGGPRRYSTRSACSKLSGAAPPGFSAVLLIEDVLAQIEENWRSVAVARTPSAQNWRFVKQLKIAGHNQSAEKILEKAIVRAAGEAWVNQVPTASGLVNSTSDKHRNLDLVFAVSPDCFEFIELKIGSDTPLYAAIEMLQYGALYLFSRANFPQSDKQILAAKAVSLRVLSPFPENNIVVWDWQAGHLTAAGYKINKGTSGVRCMATTSHYSAGTFKVAKSPDQKLSKFITDDCRFLVNVSVLKNHFVSGVSLSMKNHYGSVSNPDALQHDGGAIGSIPSINALEPVRTKQVVAICDAIFGVISGGPDNSPQVSPKSILFSRDPVALDYTGAKMLEANGCRTAKITGSAGHITIASQPPYSLGTCDPNQIEMVNVENPSSITGVETRDGADSAPDGFSLSPNYPNPFNSGTVIEYNLDRPAWVKLYVFDVRGECVRMLEDGMREAGSHRSAWDGVTTYGRPVPSGTYIARLECWSRTRTVRMQMVR